MGHMCLGGGYCGYRTSSGCLAWLNTWWLVAFLCSDIKMNMLISYDQFDKHPYCIILFQSLFMEFQWVKTQLDLSSKTIAYLCCKAISQSRGFVPFSLISYSLI